MDNPLLKKAAMSYKDERAFMRGLENNKLNPPKIKHRNPLSFKEESEYLRLKRVLMGGHALSKKEQIRFDGYREREHELSSRGSELGPYLKDLKPRPIVDEEADFPDMEYPVHDPEARRFLKEGSSLLKKRAGVGGFDYHIRETMEDATDARVGEPLENGVSGENPLAAKNTDVVPVAPNPVTANVNDNCYYCAECGQAYGDGEDLAKHEAKTKHHVWDDDIEDGDQESHPPIETEVKDAEFFKEGEEGEDEIPVDSNLSGLDPLQKALKALEELALTTDDDDVRDCCRMTIEDLQGTPTAITAATKSYGETPAHPTPLGGTPNATTAPPLPPVPPAPTAAPAPAVPNAVPPVVGQPLTPEQAMQLQQTASVDQAVEMKPSTTVLPPSANRKHLTEEAKEDDIVHIISSEETSKHTCPNCSADKIEVIDEEDGEKLCECIACGAFFTI